MVAKKSTVVRGPAKTLSTKIERGLVRQIGVIVFGGGLNASHWIDKAKGDGYSVYLRDGRAELYK